MKIIDDSRKINKGDIFVAIDKGHDFIKDAINKGAEKIINEKEIFDVETIIVNDSKEYIAHELKEKFKKDFKKTTLIGITGTNGKTTTAYLIYQLFNSLNIKCAYIGTIGFYLDNKFTSLNNTTPDLVDLYTIFEECFKHKVKVIVMEVSSHALALNRVLGLEFNYAIFSNLTHDHLDFHHDLNDYKNAKKRLFNMLKCEKKAILNSDSPYFQDFIFKKNKNITYGTNGNYKLVDYELLIDKSIFKVEVENKIYDITLNIPGKYNIYNYLSAFALLKEYGIKINKIIEKTKFLKCPPGRMELIKKNNYFVFVDYAHTPDAVLNVLKNVHEYKINKVITIIGCGGNRDKLKRPIMGDIATNNSDYVIFTNDNPRNENEEDIMKDIVYNLDKANYEIIFDREIAIKKGIELLDEFDLLLILGKGHETYQIIGNEKHDFNDKLVALKYLDMK